MNMDGKKRKKNYNKLLEQVENVFLCKSEIPYFLIAFR